jgi:chitinase
MASDISYCQSQGKAVILSLGGADSSVGLSSSSQATEFAQQIWDIFLGGSSSTRPFGDVVLDGVDLDIEHGSPNNYGTFVNELKSLGKKANRNVLVTAAPQCPYPDANIGPALNEAPFDAVFVQFYNNYCELSAPSDYNIDTWFDWAKNTSPNPDVKVFIGAAASKNAAGQGYVDAGTLAGFAQDAQKKSASFGGVMLWDASEAKSE